MNSVLQHRWARLLVVLLAIAIAFVGGWMAHRQHQLYFQLHRPKPWADPQTQTDPIAGMFNEAFKMEAARQPQAVLLGDSILSFMRIQPWWPQFSDRGVADYAVPSNTAASLLWQIRNGILDGIRPSTVTLMIGTNNLTAGASPSETAALVKNLVTEIHRRLPAAKVSLLSPLPRWDVNCQYSRAIVELRRYEAADCPQEYVSIVDSFDNHPTLFVDGLHPTVDGYAILESKLQSILWSSKPAVPISDRR